MLRHVIIKLSKDRELALKAARERWFVTYKEAFRLLPDFSAKKNTGQKGIGWYVQNAEKKKTATKTTVSSKNTLQKKEEILILCKIKAEGVHYHYTCSAGNVKGSPAEWKQKMLLAT